MATSSKRQKTKATFEVNLPDGDWVVVGIVFLQKSKANQSFKKIKVAFAKIKEPKDIYESNVMRLRRGEILYSSLLASYIAIFQPGSIWRKTHSRFHCVLYPSEHNFDESFFGKNISSIGEIQKFVTKGDFELGQVGFSHCLEILNSKYILVIPCAEILRVEYGFSHQLVQAVLGGPSSWSSRLYNPYKSLPGDTSNTRKPHIHLPKHLSHNEILIKTIANLIFDKDVNRKAAGIHSSLLKNENKRYKTTQINAVPLSAQRITVKFLGKELKKKVNGRHYVLVHNILEWDAPLPIKDVSYSTDLDSRQGENKDDDLPLSNYPEKDFFEDNLEVSEHNVKSDSLADTNKESYEHLVPLPKLPFMDNIRINKSEKKLQSVKGKIIPGKGHSNTNVSGGDTIYNDLEPAPLEINHDNATDTEQFSASKGMIDYAKAMIALESRLKHELGNQRIEIQSIQGTSSRKLEEVSLPNGSSIDINALPSFVNYKQYQFSFVDKTKAKRRTYFLFEVKVNLHFFYIFKIERRPEENSIAAFVLLKKDTTKCSDFEIKRLIACSVINGPTILPKSKLNWLNRQTIKHLKDDTPEDIARRTTERILDAVCLKKGRLVS